MRKYRFSESHFRSRSFSLSPLTHFSISPAYIYHAHTHIQTHSEDVKRQVQLTQADREIEDLQEELRSLYSLSNEVREREQERGSEREREKERKIERERERERVCVRYALLCVCACVCACAYEDEWSNTSQLISPQQGELAFRKELSLKQKELKGILDQYVVE